MQREPTKIRTTTSTITWRNRRDHILARIGVRRAHYRPGMGLHALGRPSSDSPVFVTADYALSFDALRGSLEGIDCYILVLETQGINVWCAAGKGTFGTEELVNRIQVTNLDKLVRHRLLILPQLGAAGVSAHEVRKRTGFKVEYGPVRARDLPEYLRTGKASPEIRRVTFNLGERLTVAAVELTLPSVVVGLIILVQVLRGMPVFSGQGAAAIATLLSAYILFPILLPYIPTRDFGSKGLILGGLTAFPFALVAYLVRQSYPWWFRLLGALPASLVIPSIVTFAALTFVGSTTFMSKSALRQEMFTYLPVVVWCFIIGIALTVVRGFIPP